MAKQKQKQIMKVYKARNGSPFKMEDAQEIGEFIENCSDKSSKGILEEIKRHPEHKIYRFIEWDNKKAGAMYRLQAVRNIINHLEVDIVRIGNTEPTQLNVSVSAFQSVMDDVEGKIYVSMEDGISNDFYRQQIIKKARTELINWTAKYNQYKELAIITQTIKSLLIKIKA